MTVRLPQLVRRVLSTPPRQLLRRLRPIRIDELLYELAVDDAVLEPPRAFTFGCYEPGAPSGDPSIDPKLSSTRHCYAFRDGTQLAHVSWLFYDTLLPARFGFDAATPVIGDCATLPEYRGRQLYPRMLRAIAADARARHGCPHVYILVSPENHASIRGIERAGARRVARLRGLRVAGVMVRKQDTRAFGG